VLQCDIANSVASLPFILHQHSLTDETIAASDASFTIRYILLELGKF